MNILVPIILAIISLAHSILLVDRSKRKITAILFLFFIFMSFMFALSNYAELLESGSNKFYESIYWWILNLILLAPITAFNLLKNTEKK